ncbi:MAG TPA: TolC family protein [Candidatus Deferrimicrobium sp.]|nr:TolC family protein [Candidatus Deferrimicrobium sp.]
MKGRISGRFCIGRQQLPGVAVGLLLLSLIGPGKAAAATVITVSEARRRAVEFNRMYLAAIEEVTMAQADIVKARAGALPHVSAGGSYMRSFLIPSFFVEMDNEVVELKTGFKNNFAASVSLQQSLWQGGKVFTALAIARLYRTYTDQRAEATRREVIHNAELLFYSAVLQKSRREVLYKGLEAARHNLDVIEKLYSRGLVSEFEVLRARVEKANLQPTLLSAESEVTLSEKRLKSFLGIDLGEPITMLDETDDTSLVDVPPLATLTDTALSQRPEMRQANLLLEIIQKAIKVAKAGHYPSLSAVSVYNWQSVSNKFTLSDNTSESWTAGLTLSIPIFTGGYTGGEVAQRRVEYRQAELAATQLKEDIKLEVEQAYDQLLQGKKALDVQRETIAQAEEGLRIANLRYETGVGTLLEVLSAQAALTASRSARAEALFFFRQAASRLKRATTIDLDAG